MIFNDIFVNMISPPDRCLRRLFIFQNFVFIRLRFPQVTTEHELIKSLISPFNLQNGLADNCSRVLSSSPIGRRGSRDRMPDSDWSIPLNPCLGWSLMMRWCLGRHTLHHHLAGWGALGGAVSQRRKIFGAQHKLERHVYQVGHNPSC